MISSRNSFSSYRSAKTFLFFLTIAQYTILIILLKPMTHVKHDKTAKRTVHVLKVWPVRVSFNARIARFLSWNENRVTEFEVTCAAWMRAEVTLGVTFTAVWRLPFRMETIVTRDSAKVRRENSSGWNLCARNDIFDDSRYAIALRTDVSERRLRRASIS